MWTALRNTGDVSLLFGTSQVDDFQIYSKRKDATWHPASNGILSFLGGLDTWKSFHCLIHFGNVLMSIMCTLQSVVIGFVSVQSTLSSCWRGNKQKADFLFISVTQCLWMALEHHESWGQALPPSRTLFVLGMCAGCFCYYWEQCKPQHDLEGNKKKKKKNG